LSDDRRSGKTYGGFFPIDLPSVIRTSRSTEHLAGCLRFYSARSAIAELIRANGISDVLVPGYLCPAVNQAVLHAGATCRTFRVSPGFTVDPVDLIKAAGQDTLVIMAGYFGVYMPDPGALEDLMDFAGCRVLLDYAQALYAPCPDRFAAVYSPRKFLGVTDGGLLVAGRSSRLETPPEPQRKVDPTLFGDRMACHSVRLEYPDGDVLGSFRRLEGAMPLDPYRMSDIATRIFDLFDHDSACAVRLENYNTLSSTLRHSPPAASSIPLCFPTPVAREVFGAIRRSLLSKGVYVPHYWPVMEKSSEDLAETALCLPVDQRYARDDMIAMAGLVRELMDEDDPGRATTVGII
jgi:hypothetical protein